MNDACWPASAKSRHAFIDDRLDSMAFRINDERRVIVLAVVRSRTGRAIIGPAMRERCGVELVNGLTRLRSKREMKTRAGCMRTCLSKVDMADVGFRSSLNSEGP
jgi:hypothetical protein